MYDFPYNSNKNNSDTVYTSEKSGCDEKGDGSELKPYKSVLCALMKHSDLEQEQLYVDSKQEGEVCYYN